MAHWSAAKPWRHQPRNCARSWKTTVISTPTTLIEPVLMLCMGLVMAVIVAATLPADIRNGGAF